MIFCRWCRMVMCRSEWYTWESIQVCSLLSQFRKTICYLHFGVLRREWPNYGLQACDKVSIEHCKIPTHPQHNNRTENYQIIIDKQFFSNRHLNAQQFNGKIMIINSTLSLYIFARYIFFFLSVAILIVVINESHNFKLKHSNNFIR